MSRSRTPNRSSRSRSRTHSYFVALLIVFSMIVTACTPAEIEGTIERMSVSFEQGGAERGLAEAIFLLNMAIPVIEMRLGSALGP